MAKFQNRLTENREELGGKLPLSQPYVVVCDPSSICNLRCVFCPTGDEKLIAECNRPAQVMRMDTFKRLVDGFSDFDNPLRVLRMYKEGEPLVNPLFPEMVSYAKQSKLIERVDTITNGVLLEPSLNDRLMCAGIDQINISVNGVDDCSFYRNTHRHVDFKKYYDNIIDLFKRHDPARCTIYIKCIKETLTCDEQELFVKLFESCADRIFFEHLIPNWPKFDVSRSGYDYGNEGNLGQKIKDRNVCPFIFYMIVVNSDGSVSTCVQDWTHEQIVGNICEESIKSIFQGSMMKSYQMAHLNGLKESLNLCGKCGVLEYGLVDDIDDYAEEIKRKMI